MNTAFPTKNGILSKGVDSRTGMGRDVAGFLEAESLLRRTAECLYPMFRYATMVGSERARNR